MARQKSGQKRVAIWSPARSMSTVLTRSLSQIPNSQAIFEMFSTAAAYERHWIQGENSYRSVSHTKVTFESVKALCENPWPGKSVIVLKELAHGMAGKFEMIFDGYRHFPDQKLGQIHPIVSFHTSTCPRGRESL